MTLKTERSWQTTLQFQPVFNFDNWTLKISIKVYINLVSFNN